ncbi:MAG: hypothetical protein J7M24_07740, partial [Candidatus Latescibacteria bacterium]|nr:hypothetical protein [Candidatus Latescibacterota bacterium]
MGKHEQDVINPRIVDGIIVQIDGLYPIWVIEYNLVSRFDPIKNSDTNAGPRLFFRGATDQIMNEQIVIAVSRKDVKLIVFFVAMYAAYPPFPRIAADRIERSSVNDHFAVIKQVVLFRKSRRIHDI